MIADMKNKWMPASLAFGVTKWEAVQTGTDSGFIIATYPDKATADAGADKAAAVRAQTQDEYRDLVPTILQGEVIVSN
jgi:hypothetical protein